MPGSTLERRFALYWRGLNGPPLVLEHRFATGRRWRFDFACPLVRVAIEVEGGTWSGGRHTRGAGFSADCEKYNAAAHEGWTVFRLTGAMITVPEIERIIRFVRTRQAPPISPTPIPAGATPGHQAPSNHGMD
jgi:very-short-patch-repair endonuclease